MALALSAAYLAVGLGQGDELITTRALTATASSAALGAKPIFAMSIRTGAITAATIAPLITPVPRPLLVHLAGWPAICQRSAILHAHMASPLLKTGPGPRLHRPTVGSFGDAAWSFCQTRS